MDKHISKHPETQHLAGEVVHYREYKILLQPDRFRSKNGFLQFWETASKTLKKLGLKASTGKSDLTVCSIPSRSRSNPYIALINAHLEKLGVEILKPTPTLKAISEILRPGLVLHFHWPSRLYSPAHAEDFSRSVRRWEDFLGHAKDSGCRIVWTVHNLYPHETASKDWDRVARTSLVKACDHIVLHCERAVTLVEREFGALPRVSVLRHPSFEVIPVKRDAKIAQSRARQESALIFLIFGNLREYKNLEFAVQTFAKLRQANARLIIAGAPHPFYSIAKLNSLCEKDERVILRDAEVPEVEVPALFAAADVVLFCYQNVLTSGAVALAQSFSKPIVAPRLGCLPEMVPPEAGELYEAGSENSLLRAMQRITARDLEALGKNGRRLVGRETPSSFAQKLADIYKQLME